MRTISIALSALLVAAVLLNPATASAQAGLREGVKVRVSIPGAPRTTGVIQSVTPDSIVLFAEPNGARIGIARRGIQSLQVSQGKSGSAGAWKGAMWGAGLLGASGVIIAVSAPKDDPIYDNGSGGRYSPAGLIAQTVVVGAATGALIGAFVKSEKWETVTVQPTVGASANGLRVGFNIR